LRFAWNPHYYTHLVRLGLFPNIVKARKRTARLRDRQKLTFLGLGPKNERGGRPPDVHGRYKPEHLFHDLMVTDLIFPHYLQGAEVERGHRLPYFSDAHMTKNGRVFHWEYDSGSRGNQISAKRLIETYPHEDFGEFVLLVTSSEDRKKRLLERLEPLGHCILTTTRKDALERPHEAIWQSYKGTFVQF
jgi:hypothetical protein